MTHQTAISPTARRHDLDALRAIAMLLGIVLHATLPYLYDDAVIILYPLLGIIHGFRMPLFFLLSGFFVAMLWRRHGIGKLLRHRFHRILLPLIVFTPIVTAAFIGIGLVGSAVTVESSLRDADQTAAVWSEIAARNVEGIEEIDNAAQYVNVVSDDDWRPLHLAALLGHYQMAEWLINQEADVTTTTDEGWTALDIALANDHRGIVELLRKNGGFEGEGGTTDIPTLGGLAGSGEDEGGIDFFHLWFLWFLWWLVVGFALVAYIIERLPMPRIPSRWVVTPLRFVWLIPLTMIFQMQMEIDAFGPDTFTGLLIPPYLLFYYAIFFGFGALYYHYQEEAADIGRGWWLAIPLCILVIFPLTLGLQEGAAAWSLLTALLMVSYTWLMSFGFIGLFRTLFWQENKLMRYISDSSYFLYIMHLPLILLLSGLLGSFPVPDLGKFVIISVVTTVILLLLYHIAVRYTFIGRFLNGPRHRPAPVSTPLTEIPQQV